MSGAESARAVLAGKSNFSAIPVFLGEINGVSVWICRRDPQLYGAECNPYEQAGAGRKARYKGRRETASSKFKRGAAPTKRRVLDNGSTSEH